MLMHNQSTNDTNTYTQVIKSLVLSLGQFYWTMKQHFCDFPNKHFTPPKFVFVPSVGNCRRPYGGTQRPRPVHPPLFIFDVFTALFSAHKWYNLHSQHLLNDLYWHLALFFIHIINNQYICCIYWLQYWRYLEITHWEIKW